MLRQTQSTQSWKPEACHTIKSAQRRPAGMQPYAVQQKQWRRRGGWGRKSLMQMEKSIYCFPKGHCVLYTAYRAQQQTYSCCARVSLDQPAAPTIELQPVLVQHVLVASC